MSFISPTNSFADGLLPNPLFVFSLALFFCFSFLFLISRIQLNVRTAVNPKTFGIWSFSKFTLLLAHSCLFRMSLKSCFVQAAGCGRSESHMDTHTHTALPLGMWGIWGVKCWGGGIPCPQISGSCTACFFFPSSLNCLQHQMLLSSLEVPYGLWTSWWDSPFETPRF